MTNATLPAAVSSELLAVEDIEVIYDGTILAVAGVSLRVGQGDIVAFDLFCMLLERERQVQLVYKHAISTVQPNGPINLTGDGDEEGAA